MRGLEDESLFGYVDTEASRGWMPDLVARDRAQGGTKAGSILLKKSNTGKPCRTAAYRTTSLENLAQLPKAYTRVSIHDPAYCIGCFLKQNLNKAIEASGLTNAFAPMALWVSVSTSKVSRTSIQGSMSLLGIGLKGGVLGLYTGWLERT